MIFGRDQISPFDLNDKEAFGNKKDCMNDFVNNLSNAKRVANEMLVEYRSKMKKARAKKLGIRKPLVINVGDMVILRKRPEEVPQGLSRKLDDRGLGPFKVISVNNEKGNVTISLAPNTNIEVKICDVRKTLLKQAIDDAQDFRLIKGHKKDVLVIFSPKLPDFEEVTRESTPEERNSSDVRAMLGKRIEVKWTQANWPGNHRGTVVGFKGKKNLVFYDDSFKDRVPTDYYGESLFGKTLEWKFLEKKPTSIGAPIVSPPPGVMIIPPKTTDTNSTKSVATPNQKNSKFPTLLKKSTGQSATAGSPQTAAKPGVNSNIIGSKNGKSMPKGRTRAYELRPRSNQAVF